MEKLLGVIASEGVAVGKLFFLPKEDELVIPNYVISDEDVSLHEKRLMDAFDFAKKDLKKSIQNLNSECNSLEKTILQTHLSMISDADFIAGVVSDLRLNKINVEYTFKKKVDEIVDILNSQGDDYLRARTIDIKDSYLRVLNFLIGEKKEINQRFKYIPKGSILVAKEIKPSEASFIRDLGLAGIITKEGSKTSHISIMARAWSIPMLVGVANCLELSLSDSTLGIIDGNSGVAFFDPTAEKINEYEKIYKDELTLYEEALLEQEKYQNHPVKTADGVAVKLYANIAIPDEISAPFLKSADGIGLFRTEFLCLENGVIPDEEYQAQVYSNVVKAMNDKPLVIRTFDIGADKAIKDHIALAEKNPMLGWRGIRYLLENKTLLKNQLKAIVRSSAFGDVRILLPMISSIDEVIEVKSVLNEAIADCKLAGHNCKEKIPLGIMIEVPSVAIISDVFANYVDFMSIGTNDLVQYVMATDRENTKVVELASYFQPAVLRLLNLVIQSANKIDGVLEPDEVISMCGEMASDKNAVVLLLAMGLRNFSMSARSISKMKKFISQLNYSDAVEIFNSVKDQTSSKEIKETIRKKLVDLKIQ